MVRGGKGGSKRDFKKRVGGDRSSDDSDEDYVVSDEQSDASEDALNDLAGSASEDGLAEPFNDEVFNEDDGADDDDDYVEEVDEVAKEDEEVDALALELELEKEEEEEVDAVEKEEEAEEGGDNVEEAAVVKSDVKWGSSGPRKSVGKTSRKRNRVSLEEEEKEEEEDDDEDYDANDDDDEGDEEFTPDEDECLDDDEEDSLVNRRNRCKLDTRKELSEWGTRRKVVKNSKKRTKKIAARKSLKRKKGRKVKQTRKKARHNNEDEDEDNDDISEDKLVVRERVRKTSGRSRRRYMVRSDSDMESSGSSDFEYTISEEEREQIREANEFCGNLALVPLRGRSSSPERSTKDAHLRLKRAATSKKTEKFVDLPLQRKSSSVKGKQKVEEVKIKQVCGICLSEEDKRRVRGTLNCCSHYFCFTCIMEWSKVETRCPLCKQRFQTISKPARSAPGADPRDVIIQVPERDQVYQPSEEEIRGYLDPYENVICTECHQGGDDGLMLLCDICDSPAHTYCVGLGREVPEGNWYCEGCRPGVFGSSSTYLGDPILSDQRVSINGGDGLDLNVVPSPMPFTQGVGGLASPRFNGVINQAASQFSGAGAATVSERRRAQRHIHQILTGHRFIPVASRTDWRPGAHIFPGSPGSRIDQFRSSQNPEFRNPEVRASFEIISGERLPETSSPSVRGTGFVQSGQNLVRRQGLESVVGMPPNNIYRACPFDVHEGMNGAALAHEQPPVSTSCRSSLGAEFIASPHIVKEESQFDRANEQVHSLVKNHLKSISKDLLAHDDFKDIARSSTHTILAACGLDHHKSEVQACPLQPPLPCWHSERASNGQTSLMNGLCSACFDMYVRSVVESVMNKRSQPWLSLGL